MKKLKNGINLIDLKTLLQKWLNKEINLKDGLKVSLNELYNLKIDGLCIKTECGNVYLTNNGNLKIKIYVVEHESCTEFVQTEREIMKLQDKYNIGYGDKVEKYISEKFKAVKNIIVTHDDNIIYIDFKLQNMDYELGCLRLLKYKEINNIF